jgi:hypothetical protein
MPMVLLATFASLHELAQALSKRRVAPYARPDSARAGEDGAGGAARSRPLRRSSAGALTPLDPP